MDQDLSSITSHDALVVPRVDWSDGVACLLCDLIIGINCDGSCDECYVHLPVVVILTVSHVLLGL